MASDLGRGADPAASESYSPKDEQALKKRLNKLADALKWLAGNTVEAFSAIVGSVIGALLRVFLQGCWICCWTYLEFDCSCCRAYSGMVDEKK